MQIAVADVGVNAQGEGIFFHSSNNVLHGIAHLVHGHNHIISGAHEANQAHGFQAVTAHSPNAVIRLQHLNSTAFLADIIELLHLHIQLILGKGFDRENYVNAILHMGCTSKFQKLAGGTHIGIIHIFDASRSDACLGHLGHHAHGLHRISEDGQHIQSIGRQGLQLKRHLGNDAQGALTANNQLLHAVAGRAFFQGRAQIHNLALRSDNLHSIDLITGYTVAHGLIATGIGRKVATDLAAFGAAGVTSIEKACFVGHLLNIHSAHTSLGDEVHALFI